MGSIVWAVQYEQYSVPWNASVAGKGSDRPSSTRDIHPAEYRIGQAFIDPGHSSGGIHVCLNVMH